MHGRPAAITALAQGHTTTQAATAAGVTVRTVQRWINDPDFALNVRDARKDLLQHAVGRLAAGAVQAVDTLLEALEDDSTKVRVMAARTLLDTLLPLRESLELEERIAALETADRQEP
ncbi:helix-turn-helix domain-containing protein [Streptomyces antibioticus]|uniref:helix-turn-helix domain-containing protein n=1 Tax=Streptomyces antibioticus TaxID=1890 RepID=UPI0033B717A5